MINQREKELLKELAKRYSVIANDERNAKRIQRMRDNNELQSGRPPVLIEEIPWHEMNQNQQLTLQCEHDFARTMETFFRRKLFAFEHFQVDMIAPDFYPIHKSFHSSGNGFEVKEHTRQLDQANNISSHSYIDQIATEEDLSKFTQPILTAFPEIDETNMNMAEDILHGILPSQFVGSEIYYAPWDQIPRLRGVEPILFDMIDRPEFLHKIIQIYTTHQDHLMTQAEKLGLYNSNQLSLHCTPPYTNSFKNQEDGTANLKNMWFRSMAQMFGSVSTDMWKEFELDYMRPLMARCGLVYYGCCEALDQRIELLKTVPNMRKIGVSAWANLESCAEQIGSQYVYARKPNPAYVAKDFDRDVVYQETEAVVKACIKHGCPYEFVLKDISTVSYRPENLSAWASTVTEVLDKYYN